MTTDQYSRSSNTTSGAASQGSRSGSSGSGGGSQDLRAQAGDAVSTLTDAAQQAGSQAKQAASSLASEASQKAKGLLNQQVAAGAELVGHVADSAKSAAESLDRTAPQLAGLVRGAADRIEDFSRDIRGQSAEELMKAASDFTRRQPALVFGLASVAGFLLVRILKSSPPSPSQSGRYADERFGESRSARFGASASQFHGA